MKRNLFFVLLVLIASIAGFLSIKLYNYYLTKTYQQSSENTFYLLSLLVDHYLHELKDIQKEGVYNLKINEIFDSIVASSELLYFAVLDENKSPVVFSTIYDEYLPIRGEGEHIVKTPVGNIYQIEKKLFDTYFISGFALKPLERIRLTNNILFIVIFGVFVVVSSILFFNLLQVEMYTTVKDEEIASLREFNALATGFSHEFRNSLHTLSLLARELNYEEGMILNNEIKKMKTIMDSLKLLSRMEIRKEKIEVHSLISEVLSICRDIIPEDLKIEQNINHNLRLKGDHVLLTTAFVNLIRNSIEAKAKNIKINGIKKGSNIVIELIDDGMGIDKNELGRIFEPFYSKKGQTGLGLYLVKKIITAHSGNIEVSSDKETSFVISFKEGKL
ncbi:MAG: sensor histidine kinase [bacterium]